MKVYVGVTDRDWIRLLSARADLDQANFWLPSSTQGFQALDHGGLFLFKSKVADGNQIVGAGVFDVFVRTRVLDAWNWFGADNGVESLDRFVDRVRKYRGGLEHLPYDTEIGSVLLRMVEFFPESDRPPSPDDWSTQIVRGRGYETDELASDHPVVQAVAKYLRSGERIPDVVPARIREQMFGDARLVIPRLGQDAFKAVVAENYHNRCAVTGDKVRPVLQAAHILPVSEGGIHRADNGILLRSDIHTLFDQGYLGIDPHLRLLVSPRLREEFGNGDDLYARAGTEIASPDRRQDRPHSEFLEWHLESVFKRTA